MSKVTVEAKVRIAATAARARGYIDRGSVVPVAVVEDMISGIKSLLEADMERVARMIPLGEPTNVFLAGPPEGADDIISEAKALIDEAEAGFDTIDANELLAVSKKVHTELGSEISKRWPSPRLTAEQAFLGSVMLDNSVLVRCGSLLPGDFEDERHRAIYERMVGLQLQNRPIDEVTLVSELDLSGALQVAGGALYVSQLVELLPTGINGTDYAAIIRRYAGVKEEPA